MLPSTTKKKQAKKKNKKTNYVIDLCNSFFWPVSRILLNHLSQRTIYPVPKPVVISYEQYSLLLHHQILPRLWHYLVVIIIIINCQQPVNTISIQLISIRFAVLDNKSTYKNPKPQKQGWPPAQNHIVSHNHILASHHFCALTIHPFE